MGYVSKDIAIITEPKKVSLSSAPNFVTFASKAAVKTFLEYNVQVNINAGASDIENKTVIRITEPTGAIHSFHGTTDPLQVGGSVFFVSTDRSDTAENLRGALLANRWINANFEVKIPFTWSGGVAANGRVLNIKSKGTGAEFNITVTAPNNTSNVAYTISPIHATSVNDDSISGEASTAELQLDMYVDPAVFLGQNDRPLSPETLGNFAVTLNKTYAGVPLWFELNALFSQYAAFTVPPGVPGWFNTGTARAYRFIAKKRGINSFSFYQSNVLYVLNGYGYPSDPLDLSDYVYENNNVKLLTNKPRTTYVRGQKEYLNFLFSDPQRGTSTPVNFSLGLIYRVYSTSDQYLGTVNGPTRARADFNVVNTCVLNIDAVLDAYPKAGIVRVALTRNGAIISNDQEYQIRPDCLHTLNQVVFLNRFGGWDAFNFDAAAKGEIKPTTETFNKTLTPGFTKGDSIETVYSTALADTKTIEGAPVNDQVADWLKELAAARVVLDGEGNYIIKEDFSLPFTATSANMQVPTIKYRLSENFTND